MYKRLVVLSIIMNMHSYICSMDEKKSDCSQEPYAQSYWDTDYFEKNSPKKGIVSFFRTCRGRTSHKNNSDLYAMYGFITLVHPYAVRCPSGFVKKDNNNKSKTVTNLRLKIECACSCAIKGVRTDIVSDFVDNYFKSDNPWYEQWRDHKGRTLGLLALEKAHKYQDYSKDRWHIASLLMSKAPCTPQELLLLCNKIINNADETYPENLEQFLSQLRSIESALPIIQRMSRLPLIYSTANYQTSSLETFLSSCKSFEVEECAQPGNQTVVYLEPKKNKAGQLIPAKVTVRFGCSLKDAIRNGNVASVEECVTNDNYVSWFDHRGKPLEVYAFKKAQSATPLHSIEAHKLVNIAHLLGNHSDYSSPNWCVYLNKLITQRRFADISTYCKAMRAYTQRKIDNDIPLIAYMLIKCDKKQAAEEFNTNAQSPSSSSFLNALIELVKCDASIETPCLYRKNKWLKPKQIAEKRGLSKIFAAVYDAWIDHATATSSEDNSLSESSSDQ